MHTKPFLLKPSGKDYLWGGQRINTEFEKNINLSPLAETWECSTHSDGPSYVSGGEYDGMTLAEVIKSNPEYLGSKFRGLNELPILVKFIDAQDNLSIQVHPDDEYARSHENGQLGKSEMWYILDARENTRLVYGLNSTVDKETLRDSVESGDIEKYLQKVLVKQGDAFYIPAGTIHAIGKGAMIAEIQQSSNLTYRLYDYGRVDKTGRKRPLHVDKTLDVADLNGSIDPIRSMRVFNYSQGAASELLCRCRYFEVYRLLVNTERKQRVKYQSDELGYRVLLCIKGCGNIRFANETLDIYKGDCLFVPSSSLEIRINGQFEFLDIRG